MCIRDSCQYTEDHPFARDLSEKWNEGLMLALQNLPRFPWELPGGDTEASGCVMVPPNPPKAVAS
jgi:putative proteasome-type protease